MLDVEDRTFVAQTVRLDGRRFVGCHFETCRLVYAGGDAEVEACTFTDCAWDVRDAAANTVRLLEGVRRSGAYVPGGPDGFPYEGGPRQDRPRESSANPAPRERSTPELEPGRASSIGDQVADYAEWAVVAVVAAVLLLTLFLRS